ncbi:MAG TPA: hypothetical protein PLP34_10100, partial [Chitinophagaceae bacterium]|nr:hypothetical protein [Chitinophagaceae bacterium]
MNPSIVYRLLFLLCAVLFALSGKAQLSAADSLFFQSVFSGSRYFNPSGFTGSFYVFDTVHSVSDMTQQIDSQFKFNYTDIAYCDSLQTADTICHPLPENQSFNLYPFIFNRPDPIVALPFTLHQKTARSYAYRYESWMPDSCKTAFMIIPGSHENESTLMTLGLDYANQLCYMQQTMARHGDVYTLIKPNEDHRAIQWNGNRLGNYLIWYLDSANRHYGVNYLIETIAWIKFLKTRYDKVYIAGISEGGYAALLASFLSPGDGSIISGGYTILFDSLPASNAILHERFDSLVDYYHAGQVWNSIQAKTTPFCFTWGDGDPVPGMQTEHDSMLTKNYFSGLANAYSYFNFSGHTFPDCHYTDSVFYTW